jgi:hypothetical protein
MPLAPLAFEVSRNRWYARPASRCKVSTIHLGVVTKPCGNALRGLLIADRIPVLPDRPIRMEYRCRVLEEVAKQNRGMRMIQPLGLSTGRLRSGDSFDEDDEALPLVDKERAIVGPYPSSIAFTTRRWPATMRRLRSRTGMEVVTRSNPKRVGAS